MSELFIVIFATIGLSVYHIFKYLLLDSSYSLLFKIIFGIFILIILSRNFYLKFRFRKDINKFNIDLFDFKFYKTCNSLFNKSSYVISSFLYNSITQYKFTIKDFSISKNYGKDNNDTEYYLKLRLRWYSYVKFTSTRIKIALKKADNFSFNQQNLIVTKNLTSEEKAIYNKFKEDINNFSNKKIYIFNIRNIENYKEISYIFKYNLVQLHNNNILLEKYIKNFDFMTKKFEQYTNDIRAYKRLN